MFKEILTDLFNTISDEPTFVNAVLHEGTENAHEILVYETWNESVEDFLRVQMQRDYRIPFEEALVKWEITREVGIYYPFATWQAN